MANSSEKMKLRAELMSVLNKYTTAIEIDNDQLKNDIEILKEFPDREFLCKALFKELLGKDNLYTNVCAIIIIEAVENEIFEAQVYDLLKDEKVSDDKKFYFISILKQKGLTFDYDTIDNYIMHPEELAQNGVKDFLNNAIEDPEVQLDLLDFYVNIPEDERLSLLNNLIEEFQGDDLGNALSLIAQLDNLSVVELEYLVNGLIKAKSSYSIEGLRHILNNYKFDKKSTKTITTATKEIEFAHPNFINTALIKDTKVLSAYMSFIDGNSNFSLTLSRLRENKTVDVVLITINIMQGITSCMGFGSINQENYNAVMNRVFSDSIPIKIPPSILKGLSKYYYEKNKKLKIQLPYEYIVWKNLFNDIKDLKGDVAEIINSKLDTVNLTERKVRKFSSSNLLSRWYYLYGQNEHIDELIKTLEQEHIVDMEKINELTEKLTQEKFVNDKNYRLELQTRLLLQSYAAFQADLKMMSANAYSLCFENPYIPILVNSIIDKSLYCYFAQKIEDIEEGIEENVFKNEIESKYTKEEAVILMEQLEEKWNQKKE